MAKPSHYFQIFTFLVSSVLLIRRNRLVPILLGYILCSSCVMMPCAHAQAPPLSVQVSSSVGSAWDPVIAGLPSPTLANGAMADIFVAYTSTEKFSANCLTGASFTTDGGGTWSKSNFTCLPAGSTDFDVGQPATVYDPVAGQIYLVTNRLSTALVPTLYIQTSTDGGATFGSQVPVVSGASGTYFYGPFSVVVDTSGTSTHGKVYIGYPQSSFDGTMNSYNVVVSTDHGVTWGAPGAVAAGLPMRPLLSNVVTGIKLSSARLTEDQLTDQLGLFGVDDVGSFRGFVSTDGGRTWTEVAPPPGSGPMKRVSATASINEATGSAKLEFDEEVCSDGTTTCSSPDILALSCSFDGNSCSALTQANQNPTGVKEPFATVTGTGSNSFLLDWYRVVDSLDEAIEYRQCVGDSISNLSCDPETQATENFSSATTSDPQTPYTGIANLSVISDPVNVYMTYVRPNSKTSYAAAFFKSFPYTTPCPAVSFDPAGTTLPGGQVGQPYFIDISVTPANYTIKGDPNSSALSGINGLDFIDTGVPNEVIFKTEFNPTLHPRLQEAGTFSVTVTAAPPTGSPCPSATQTYSLTIAKATPAINVMSDLALVSFGQTINLKANVQTPGVADDAGSVTFFDGSTPLGNVPLANNSASLAVPGLAVGSHSITAALSADANYTAATSPAAVTVTVVPEDVTARISTTASGLLYSRVTKTFNGSLTLKNITNSTIDPPLNVVFASGVTLVNATGMYQNKPYIKLPHGLAPGQSMTITVRFSDVGGLETNPPPVDYRGGLESGK